MWSVRLIKFSSLVALALTIAACGGDEAGSDTDGGNNPPANIAPIANAGEDQTVNEQTTVTLSGSGTDADGSIASYSWSQTTGSEVELNNPSSPSTTFMAPDISVEENFVFQLTVTDNGGAITTDTVSITISPISLQLKDATFSYSDIPTLNEELTITIIAEEELGGVEWEVVSQPQLSNLMIDISDNSLSASFTATEPGEYKIVSRSIANESEKIIVFDLHPLLPFDVTKIEGYDDSIDIEEISGEIINQSWVSSSKLSQIELADIVSEYTEFNIIGYDEVFGLLIEYDEKDLTIVEILEELATRIGVDEVRYRYHQGERTLSLYEIYPNDCSNKNPRPVDCVSPMYGWDDDDGDDGDENWHLEFIGMPTAWTYTTGSEDINVGISEFNYDAFHPELSTRTNFILSKHKLSFKETVEEFESRRAHGNSSAGSIGAYTDNRKGISGINWVSKLSLGNTQEDGIKHLLEDDKVAVVNMSWGRETKLIDPQGLIAFELNYSWTHGYRKIANKEKNKDVLFVWAAGNGIKNATLAGGQIDCAKTLWGIDAKYSNGAIDYTKFGIYWFRPVENVIQVAALQSDGLLTYYSNYGESVDIAAPTGYESLDKSDSIDQTFGYRIYTGTSAAAPVVTGVASLIYSLYPGFSGKEVKDILINSATKPGVMKRYTQPPICPRGNETDDLKTKSGSPQYIPVLNAENALKLANSILSSKVIISHNVPNPFSPIVAINFKSIDENFEFKNADIELMYSNDNGVNWEPHSSTYIIENNTNLVLPANENLFLITAGVTMGSLINGEDAFSEKEHKFSVPETTLLIKDTVSNLPLSNVEISIEKIDGVIYSDKGMSDADGSTWAYLEAGSYKVRGILNGYQDTVTFATVSEAQNNLIVLNMTEESAGEIGALSGRVFDEIGSPITNAFVRISGGAQTDGFFASVTTDANGNYNLNNISKFDEHGESISTFILEVSADGYETIVRDSVIVLPGNTRAEHFILPEQVPEIPEPPSKYLVFTEGNPGVEEDGHYINASTTDNIVEYSLTAERKPLIGTLENGVIITVVTELPTDQAFAQVYFEFGYLDSECLYVADDNNNETDARNNFEAAYYSPRGLEVITESARARSGCENINVSNMFLNRIEFLNFELTNISVDAVIVERGPIIQEPPPSIYGSLTITNDDQADRTWEPTSGIGIPSARSLTGQWFGDGGSYLQLSLPINPDIDVLATITFRTDFSFTTLWCLDADGVIGASVCSGVTTDPLKKTVTFSNVQMAEPPFGENVFTLNGTLRY